MRLFKMRHNSPDGAVVECSRVELDEESLEDLLEAHIEMLDPGLCVIGRQIKTDDGGRLDLLAIDEHGDTAIIELKREKATRSAIAQALGYAAWVDTMTYDDLNDIAKEKHLGSCADLRGLLQSKFGTVPETWNEGRRMYIVAPEFDETTENIVVYLDKQEIDINCVWFNIYRHDAEQFVSVSPMFDESPDQAESES